jgi:hypothetical protein
LFALHNAAAAGPKRLSSHTYLALNGAVIVNGLFRLNDLLGGFKNIKLLLQPTIPMAANVLALVAAKIGIFRGVTYKEK